MNYDLISVIVPVYNVELYLEQCLNSIINQTYKNLEIILVNDGSTDNSGVICDLYANIDNRIIVIHKDNGGVSSARNAGLNVAKGNFIGFVDPDDWIADDMYEKLYLNIQNFNANISVCKFRKVMNRENIFEKNSNSEVLVLNPADSMHFMLAFIEGYGCAVWNKLYRKNLLVKFNEKLTNGEDLLFNFNIFFDQNNSTVFLKEEKYYYYYRTGSACNNPIFKKSYLATIKLWDEISNKIYNSDTFRIIYPIVDQGLKKAIWSALFSLSYENTARNKKIFYSLKKRYKNSLTTINFKYLKYDKKDLILNVLYYLPYEIVSHIWKLWRYFKRKSYER